VKKLLVLGAALVAAAGISVAIATASSPHSGELHVTKECHEYDGGPGAFCTITSSSLNAIKAGSKVIYFQAAGGDPFESDLAVVVGPGDYALGHVTLDATGSGVVTLSGGVGDFRDFRAKVRVATTDGVNFTWDGRYSFGHDH
jgi:hypothetical protein